jgi:hypothetical protein
MRGRKRAETKVSALFYTSLLGSVFAPKVPAVRKIDASRTSPVTLDICAEVVHHEEVSSASAQAAARCPSICATVCESEKRFDISTSA